MKYVKRTNAKFGLDWDYYGELYLNGEKVNYEVVGNSSTRGLLKRFYLDLKNDWLPTVLIRDDGLLGKHLLNDETLITNLFYLEPYLEEGSLLGFDIYIETCQLKILDYVNKNNILFNETHNNTRSKTYF